MKQPGRIAIWVFCLVFLAFIVVQAGRYSFTQDNGAANYGPSGSSAFFQLIKASGYQVIYDKSLTPKVDGLVIIPVNKRNYRDYKKFAETTKGSATALVLYIPETEREGKGNDVVTDLSSGDVVGTVEPKVEIPSDAFKVLGNSDAIEVGVLAKQGSGNDSLVSVKTDGERTTFIMRDASCMTNRHIEQSDNAKILMGLIRQLGGTQQKIRYIDTFAAESVDSSILSKLGPPFEAAWLQVEIFLLVVFISLSVRFGIAPITRASQRGGRELVDGLANMTRRKRNARWALRAVFERTLTELERRHRVGREQIVQRPDLFMDNELAMEFKRIEAATMDDITEHQAVEYAKALKRLV